MLKFAAAVAALLLALAAASVPAVAGPPEDNCVNCQPAMSPAAKPYDRESAPRIRQEMDRPSGPSDTASEQNEPNSYPERSGGASAQQCGDCVPRNRYDKVEVVKTSHDVDRSGVINTESVVQVPPRVKQYNKLVVHENETRNVGVIQHNHRIIEKEIRYVKRAPAHRYHVVHRVQPVLVPVPQPQPCGCACSCGGGLLSALTQRAHGGGYAYAPSYAYAYTANPVAAQRVLVPMDVPVSYGYR
jgi:hypothetical protein